jgi:hypothetical protein
MICTGQSLSSPCSAVSITNFSSATSNLEYYVNNVPVDGGIPSNSLTFTFPTEGNTSPYDCCVSLILNPIGAIFGYTFNDFNTGLAGRCFVFEDRVGQCATGQASGLVSTITTNANLIVPSAANGNGYCGIWSPEV